MIKQLKNILGKIKSFFKRKKKKRGRPTKKRKG